LARCPALRASASRTKTVVISAMLSDKGEVLLRQRVQANQLSLVLGESEQLKALCRGRQLTAGHRSEV
jgi:hypothetical protein